jgi:hypothetical protein
MALIMMVFWRRMTPATAGPARRAEMKRLVSMVLGVLLMLLSWDVFARRLI